MIAQLSSSLRASASWSMFREWLEYFAKLFLKRVVAVPPHYTSQNCSICGTVVKKSLSVRTHSCPACKTVLDRDENAAINILYKALKTVGLTVSACGGLGSSQPEKQESSFVRMEDARVKLSL